MTPEILSQIFSQSIKENEQFGNALKILKNNNVGKVWLIGGFVYRTLAAQLYNLPNPEVDLDFIVERAPVNPVLPNGWRVGQNNFGNYKYVGGSLSLDVVPITNIHSIVSNGLQPTIENFLLGTPLTIQSIAYDVSSQKIIGEAGIQSLLSKTVSVHNFQAINYLAEKYNRTAESYILEKANSLGFNAELLAL